MAKVREHVLPETANEALVRCLHRMPEEAMLNWASFLKGGFTKPALIRERLAAILRGPEPLEELFFEQLATYCPLRELVAALSAQWLEDWFDSLVRVLDLGDFFIALLASPDPAARRLAVRAAHVDTPMPSEADKEWSLDILQRGIEEDILAPFGFELAAPTGPEQQQPDAAGPAGPEAEDSVESWGTDFVAAEPAPDAAALAKLREEIERLEGYLRDEKRRAKKKAHEDQAALDALRRDDEARIAAFQSDLTTLRSENERLVRELAEARANQEREVRAAVQAQLAAAIRRWLEEPLALESALPRTEAAAGDLLARADRALAEQAQRDRHTGNRRQLEEHLRQVQTRAEQLRQAARTALRPLPQLASLLAELEAEIARVEGLLQVTPSGSPLAGELLARINLAGAGEELRMLDSLLAHLGEAGLLPAPDRRALYEALQRRLGLLSDAGKLPSGRAEPTPGWSLTQALHQNLPCLLLIDGHNVLFQLTDLFRSVLEDGQPRAQARARLVELTRKLVAERPAVEARLIFDGADEGIRRVVPNLAVEYSGGTGQHRADQVIAGQLRFKNLQNVEQRGYVVSDDREVRSEALRQGAKYIAVDHFAVLLRHFGCLSS